MQPYGTSGKPARSSRPILIGCTVVVALGFVLPRQLTTPAEPPAVAINSSPDYIGFLLKMTAGTLMFAGICYCVLRRYKPASTVQSPTLEILATVPIASRGVVHLVRAGKRRLLLGVDLNGVKTIAELPGPAPQSVYGPIRLTPEAV